MFRIQPLSREVVPSASAPSGGGKWKGATLEIFLHFRKPVITLRFGPVYHLPPIDPDNREESLRAAADEVMCRIAAMLPERYRGFYKDYPRVKELQAEWKARGDLKLPEDV